MFNQELKRKLEHSVLLNVKTPAQYLGGEWNMVRKPASAVRGRLCLAFPDVYSIGMSNHGLQVLYAAVNRLDDWACERVFAPWPDMEEQLRKHGLPLYSLESFTPLDRFDVIGFSLQHELNYINVLTILDLGEIPLRGEHRSLRDPLVIAGGPCCQNPEPMADFIDLFVLGDGEESLPEVCRLWLEVREAHSDRLSAMRAMAERLPFAYVPVCYEVQLGPKGWMMAPRPKFSGVPAQIRPAFVPNLDLVPLPTRPLVPHIECVQDRIAIEIMRGCPWRCRFCQSTTLKRPLRWRKVQTIIKGVLETYENTGYNEVSLLSLSTSDYPAFEELMHQLKERLAPLHVSISVPSLRINEQLKLVGELLETDRRSGLTLAPEAARDDMRQQIGKPISNADLVSGCRRAFERGFDRVKLYFMCGLPGEREEDLKGIVELAETLSELRRQVVGKPATVIANVSNFVPKPHTPYQWHGMQTRGYFADVHRRLVRYRRSRHVEIKYHDVEASLLEGLLARGDRRLGAVIERAWRKGARLDGWSDHFRSDLWREAIEESGVDIDSLLHQPYELDEPLPWDHTTIRQGPQYLRREFSRAQMQLEELHLLKGSVFG